MSDVVITDTFLRQGASAHGGWSRQQFAILGVPWPPPHGWKRTVIGRRLSAAEARHFLNLKDQHLVHKHRRQSVDQLPLIFDQPQ